MCTICVSLYGLFWCMAGLASIECFHSLFYLTVSRTCHLFANTAMASISRFPTSGLPSTRDPGCLGTAGLWTVPMVECSLELQLEKGQHAGSILSIAIFLKLSCMKSAFLKRNYKISFGLYHSCRIIRAFLVEEQKIVKKVLKIQKTKDKTASK